MINLYINNKKVELDKSVNFPITYQIEDVETPTAVLSDVSKTISIPETKHNNTIFEHIYRSDRNVYNSSINFANKYYYELFDDTILISKGYVKFGKIKKTSSGNRYELTLFGQASDFFNTLDKKMLNELSFPCDDISLKHTLNKQFVKDNWSYNRVDLLSSSIHNTVNYIPAYVGTYPDFDSAKVLKNGGTIELPYDCDEWMKYGAKEFTEFRAIKQKPGVFVSKIIEGIKNQLLTGDETVIPSSVFKKDFLTINNRWQLGAMGWAFSSIYDGWTDLKAYNVMDKTSKAIVVGMPSNQAVTIPYQLRTNYVCSFEKNNTYKITFRFYAKNTKRINFFGRNDVSVKWFETYMDIPTQDPGFYTHTMLFTADGDIDNYNNFSIGIENTNDNYYSRGPEIAMGISSINVELVDEGGEELKKSIELKSDFFVNKNPYYRDAVVTCLPVQEVELTDISENETVARIWNTTQIDLLPNKPQDKWIYPIKDPNNIVKSVYEGHYIDLSNISYDRGEVIIKGRVKLTLFTPNISLTHSGEYIDALYPHWNNKNGSCQLLIKMKNFADFGNNGVLTIDLKNENIKGLPVRTLQNTYSLYFKKNDGSWVNYYEFEINCGRFINNKITKILPDLEFEFVQKNNKQWNVVSYWESFIGKKRKVNNFTNVNKAIMYEPNLIDYCISFDNKLTQNSTIDKNTLFSQDITQMQFLLEYSKLFGLYFDFEKDKNIVNVLTRNEYYSGGKIIDWNDKIDKSKDIELNPLIFEHAYIDYGLKEADTSTPLEKHKNKYDLTYGTQRINTGYQFNEDTYTAFENTIFYPVAMIEQYVNNTAPLTLPCFSKINGNIREWSPTSFELLFRQGWVKSEKYIITDDTKDMMLNDEYYWNQSNTTLDEGYKTDRDTFLLPYFSTINGNYVLDMGKPKSTWFPSIDNTFDDKTIFDKYHKNFVYDRYNVNTKKLSAYFMLNKFDVLSFSFKNFIYYDGMYWVVNKITFDPTKSESYKCELISVNDMSNYTNGQNLDWKYEEENIIATVTQDTFEKQGGTAKISIESDTYWYVYANDVWITLEQQSGFGNTTFNFTVNSNSQSGRTSAINILNSYGDVIQTIIITQASTSIIITLDSVQYGSQANTCFVSFDGVNWSNNISKEFTYGNAVSVYAKPNIELDDKMYFTGWYKNGTKINTDNPYVFPAETSLTLLGTAEPQPYAKIYYYDAVDSDGNMIPFNYNATYQFGFSVTPTGTNAASCKIISYPDWVVLQNGIWFDKSNTYCGIKVTENNTFVERSGYIQIVTYAGGSNPSQYVTNVLVRQKAKPRTNVNVNIWLYVWDGNEPDMGIKINNETRYVQEEWNGVLQSGDIITEVSVQNQGGRELERDNDYIVEIYDGTSKYNRVFLPYTITGEQTSLIFRCTPA